MPTYEYICQACGHELEIFQSMTEGAKRKCPHCGENKLKRQIGAGAGIIFKGQGYYQTDYRSKSYTEAAAKDKAGGESQESSSKESSKSTSKNPEKGSSDSSGAKS